MEVGEGLPGRDLYLKGLKAWSPLTDALAWGKGWCLQSLYWKTVT